MNSNQRSNYRDNKLTVSFESHPHDILPSSFFTNHFDHKNTVFLSTDVRTSNNGVIFQSVHSQEEKDYEHRRQRDRQLTKSSAYKRRLARSQDQHVPQSYAFTQANEAFSEASFDSAVEEKLKSIVNEKDKIFSSNFGKNREKVLRGAEIVKSDLILQLRKQQQQQNQTIQRGDRSYSDISREKYIDLLDDLEALRIMKSNSSDSDWSGKKKLKSANRNQKKKTDSPKGVDGIFQMDTRKVYMEKNKSSEQGHDNEIATPRNNNLSGKKSYRLLSKTQTKQQNQPGFEFSKDKIVKMHPQSKTESIIKSTFPYPTLSAFPDTKIMNSASFQHAQRAGLLWQTIVGTFVRFPTEWFNGERIPEMGLPAISAQDQPKWNFVCLLHLQDKVLSSLIKNKRRNGKILLHIKIMDAQENEINDIAIGCFHPNAKYVYTNNPHAESMKEDMLADDSFRDVWMALRKRSCSHNDKNIYRKNKGIEYSKVSCLEKELTLKQSIRTVGRDSPVSSNKRSVFNENVRVVRSII